MAFRISVGDDSRQYRQVGDFDDLDEAMEAFNELINQRNWRESDLVVALSDRRSGKRIAQYGLQDFNYANHTSSVGEAMTPPSQITEPDHS